MFQNARYELYFLVFFIVIITGYVRIFSPGIIRCDGPKETETTNPVYPACTSREDVGNEIRQALFDLFHRFREEITRN